MKNEDLIGQMASYFAEYINGAFGSTDPADEYYDPIYAVFGKTPTRESVLAIYKSEAEIARLSKKLTTWCENEAFTEKIVKDMLRRTIINYFGPDAITDRE